MIAGLKSFQTCYPLQHACLILGDMLELGDSSEKAHTKVGEFVAKNLPACHLITVGSEAAAIAFGARNCGFDNQRISQYSNYKELITDLDEVLQKSQKFYIKSSNGTGLHQVVKAIKELNNAI